MAATEYSYSISGDFPNQAVDSSKLRVEIAASSIATALQNIVTNGDDCDIWFVDVLSAPDETTLDGLVAAHDGVATTYLKESFSASDAEGSTSGTEWVEKATLSFNSRAGDYSIEWCAEVKTTSPAARVALRAHLDDTTELGAVDCRPDDTDTGWGTVSGFVTQTLTEGAHTVDLDYASTAATKTVWIRRARIRAKEL